LRKLNVINVLKLLFELLEKTIPLVLIFSVIKKDKLTFYVVIKYFIIMLLVAWSFNMYYPNLWASRFDLGNRLEAKSIQDRQLSYSQLDWRNPKDIIFGQGLGLNTYQAYQKYQASSIDEVQPIHNWFILALAEIGLMGVLIFLGLLYFYFKKMLQRWRKKDSHLRINIPLELLCKNGLDKEYLSRNEKKQIKEDVTRELSLRIPATPNVYDVLWDYEKYSLWFFSTQKSANEAEKARKKLYKARLLALESKQADETEVQRVRAKNAERAAQQATATLEQVNVKCAAGQQQAATLTCQVFSSLN
jgi:hypothetical protein